MTTVIAVLAVCIPLALVILVCVIKAQCAKLKAADARADKAEQEAVAYQRAFTAAESRASRLKQALAENVKVEEKANEERQELAAAPNTDLVTRANSLFGGVSDKSKN
jgi:hypothetical protein